MNIFFVTKLLLGLKGWHAAFLIGFNSGTSNSSSGSKNFPSWAKGLMTSLAPLGQQAEAQYNPAGGPLTQQANTQLSSEVAGTDLNPATNPAIAQIEGDTQQQAQQQFAGDVNQIEGSANAAGAYGNSGIPAAEAQAAQQLATGVGAQTANLENTNYQNERQIQAQAVPQAQAVNTQNLNAFLAIQNAIRGLTSQQSTDSFSFSGGI